MGTAAELMIMVTDFNDRNPVFERSRYSAQVYENLTVVCVITSPIHFDEAIFLCLLCLYVYITVLICILLCLLYVYCCICLSGTIVLGCLLLCFIFL